MKKLLSLILAVIMMSSVFSCVSVFAVEETTTPVTENTTQSETTEPSTDENVNEEPTTEPEPTYATVISEVTAKVGGVYVKWTCDGEADKYNVYRRAGGEPKPTLIATVTTLDYTDTTVKNAIYYKYHIEAVVDSEIKATSVGVLTKYLEEVKITSCKLDSKYASVNLSWERNAGARYYDLYRRSAGETQYTFIKRVAAGYSSMSDIYVGSGYHRFAIVAVDGNYKGALDTNGPLVKYFEKPSMRSPEKVENGVKINWYSCDKATGYIVYRRAGGEKSYTHLCTTKNTNYIDTTVESGKYYRYVVRAIYGSVFGPYDANGTFFQYVEKVNLEAIANASDGVYVRWTLVPGAKKYNIYRREAGGLYNRIAIVDASNGKRYKDTTAVPLEYYRYSVEAVSSTYFESDYDKNGLFIRHNPLGTTWCKYAVIKYYNFHINKSREAHPDYTMKTWQNVDFQSTTGSNNAFVNEFKNVMASQYIPANKPFVYEVTEYPEDKDFFPGPWADMEEVKSATISRQSNVDVITIVMNDQVSPEETRDGIREVSRNYFDFQGFVDGLDREGLIYSGKATSRYKNFTIVATFSKDGKLIGSTHSCKDVTASLDLNFVEDLGKIKYNAQFDTYLTYSNFVY